jgi:hypothetical protein
MNTSAKLSEIKSLLDKAQGLLQMVIEAQPKPTPGKPPQPYWTQRTEKEIWDAWEKLRAKGQFDAADAWNIVHGNLAKTYRTDSFYSSILSRWAREGYIERVREGRGPIPALYKILA